MRLNYCQTPQEHAWDDASGLAKAFKFDCLVYKMLFIRTLKPNLNVQSDSIRAKVFS